MPCYPNDFDLPDDIARFWRGDTWVGGVLNTPKPKYDANDVIRGLDKAIEALNAQSYPHYNIVEYGPDCLSVDVAVAGFAKEELSVVFDKGKLTVKGEHVGEVPDVKYKHQGIPKKSFTLTLKMDEHAKVQGAELRDGILKVNLVREIPEESKPQEIPIF